MPADGGGRLLSPSTPLPAAARSPSPVVLRKTGEDLNVRSQAMLLKKSLLG